MRKILRAAVFPIIFSMLGCVSALIQPDKPGPEEKIVSQEKRPAWTTGKPHPRYPVIFFMSGVGESTDGCSRAGDNARVEMAKQIRVVVKSVEEDLIKEIWQGGAESSHVTEIKEVVSRVTSTVDSISFEGSSVRSCWEDKKTGTFYALAVMDRSIAGEKLTKEIERDREILSDLMEKGRTLKEGRHYLPAISAYIDAYATAEAVNYNKLARKVIIGRFGKLGESESSGPRPDNDISPQAVALIIKEMAASFEIKTEGGDRQSARAGDSLPKDLAARLVYNVGADQIPIAGAPLTFRFIKGAGQLEGSRLSDLDGIARSKVYHVQAEGEIIAGLDIEKAFADNAKESAAMERFLAPLRETRAVYYFDVSAPPPISFSKDEGYWDLVAQLVRKLEVGESLSVAVFDFIDQRSKKTGNLGAVIKEEIKTELARLMVDGLELRVLDKEVKAGSMEEMAGLMGADTMLYGYYERTADKNLRLKAFLKDAAQGAIISSAKVILKGEGGGAVDQPIPAKSVGDSQFIGQMEHEMRVEQFFDMRGGNAPFKIKVWMDKKEYLSGEEVYFNFVADKDCYLTLFDYGTSGDVMVLFPNSFHKDNFIRGGLVYSIPDITMGFKLTLSGPSGMEMVKAIATDRPVSFGKKIPREVFLSMSKEDGTLNRNISVFQRALSNVVWTEYSTEIFLSDKPVERVGTRSISRRKARSRR